MRRKAQWRGLTSASDRGCVETRWASIARNIDLSERAVFDYFRARMGQRTPENEIAVRFHTASTPSSRQRVSKRTLGAQPRVHIAHPHDALQQARWASKPCGCPRCSAARRGASTPYLRWRSSPGSRTCRTSMFYAPPRRARRAMKSVVRGRQDALARLRERAARQRPSRCKLGTTYRARQA